MGRYGIKQRKKRTLYTKTAKIVAFYSVFSLKCQIENTKLGKNF